MTAAHQEASRQAVVEAALVLLERMGLSPADLAAVPENRKPVPTFAEYVPVVSVAVSAGTRRAYGSYWNRVVEHWGDRRLDEPTPSEIRQLMAYVKTHVVTRRNAHGGRSAEEHLVAALDLLGECDRGAVRVAAEEPAHRQPDRHRLASGRRVGQPAFAGAVHPFGELAATGARRAFRAGPCPDPHPPAGDLGGLHGDPGQVRQENAQADPMTTGQAPTDLQQ